KPARPAGEAEPFLAGVGLRVGQPGAGRRPGDDARNVRHSRPRVDPEPLTLRVTRYSFRGMAGLLPGDRARSPAQSRPVHSSVLGAREAPAPMCCAGPWVGAPPGHAAPPRRTMPLPRRHTRVGDAMSEVTRILSAVEQGDPQAASRLLPLVYAE